jgi:hypothetical protein
MEGDLFIVLIVFATSFITLEELELTFRQILLRCFFVNSEACFQTLKYGGESVRGKKYWLNKYQGRVWENLLPDFLNQCTC